MNRPFDLIRLRDRDMARRECVVPRTHDLSEGFSSSRFRDSSCNLEVSGRLIGRFYSLVTQAPAISSPRKATRRRVYLLDRAPTLLGNNNVGYQTEKPVERQEVERTNWRRRWREREGREKENRRANPGYVKQNYWLSGILITCGINGAVR